MPVPTFSYNDTPNGTHNDQESSEDYASNAPDASTQLEEIDSDDFPNYFLEHDGRLFPSASSLTPYPFPVDTPEQEVCHRC